MEFNAEKELINYVVNKANADEVKQFFGIADEKHNVTEKACRDKLAQMSEDVVFGLLYTFGYRFAATDIEWDTDGEEVCLPERIIMPKGIYDEDDISEYITEETGFCHYGFKVNVYHQANR